MQKGLLKLFLALFLFSVIHPGASGMPVSPESVGHEQLKASVHLLSTVKICSHANPVSYIVYGTAKPLWSGDAGASGMPLTIICQTLFGQNSRSITHSLQFCKRLLFPFHFFW
jgi:hypothetical protein